LGEFLAVLVCFQQFMLLCFWHGNTDAKKIASFKRGLNPKMMKHVGTNTRIGFNDFISDCLKQEKNNNVYIVSKTRKRAFESGSS
jgi:hypothetical protein